MSAPPSIPTDATGAPAASAPRRWRVALSIVAVALTAWVCVWLCAGELGAGSWSDQRERLVGLQQAHPLAFGAGFFLAFTLMAALTVPGCSMLALVAGLCWGWAGGALIVTVASASGATLSFLAARHLGRDAARRRWRRELGALEQWLARGGGWLVFLLRVAPVIPFPVLNPLLGLTSVSTFRFFVASALGMFAGSAVYAWAGATIGDVAGLQELLNPGLIAAVLVLLATPWLALGIRRRLTVALRIAPPAPEASR